MEIQKFEKLKLPDSLLYATKQFAKTLIESRVKNYKESTEEACKKVIEELYYSLKETFKE